MIEFNGRVETSSHIRDRLFWFSSRHSEDLWMRQNGLQRASNIKSPNLFAPLPSQRVEKEARDRCSGVYRLFECRDMQGWICGLTNRRISISSRSPESRHLSPIGMARAIKVRGMTYADFVEAWFKSPRRRVGIHLPAACAPQTLPLKAGSLPTGRQEGAQYKRKSPYREAPSLRGGHNRHSGGEAVRSQSLECGSLGYGNRHVQ